MRALLLVDLQNDFLPGGALPVPNGNEVVPIVNQLQEKFDLILATKDWHPPNHISFALTHSKQPGDVVMVEGLRQELWPVHCVQGTSGSDFSPELKTEKIKKVFLKGSNPAIDSYSTFFDNAHLRSTGLGEYLEQLGVDEIYIAGLATDYCVKFSVLDAAKLGLSIHVVLDACRGIDLKPGDILRAVEEMERAGAKILTSQQVD